MSCDLGKGTAPANGKRLRAVALTDNVALVQAWANDTRYERIFARAAENLLRPGDVACAISASGSSPNILAALNFARQAGAVTAGIAGFQGGKMKPLCDVCVVVPSENMQIIEDLHLSIAHLCFARCGTRSRRPTKLPPVRLVEPRPRIAAPPREQGRGEIPTAPAGQ